MQTAEIRRRFLAHFEQRGHTVVPSASLVADDPEQQLRAGSWAEVTLSLAEAGEGLAGREYRETVAQRREQHAREQRRRLVPRILLSDGTALYGNEGEGDRLHTHHRHFPLPVPRSRVWSAGTTSPEAAHAAAPCGRDAPPSWGSCGGLTTRGRGTAGGRG